LNPQIWGFQEEIEFLMMINHERLKECESLRAQNIKLEMSIALISLLEVHLAECKAELARLTNLVKEKTKKSSR